MQFAIWQEVCLHIEEWTKLFLQKISDGSKKKPLPEKQSRVKDMKTKYDVKHNHPMYRYDEHTHSDAFFPNYAWNHAPKATSP